MVKEQPTDRQQRLGKFLQAVEAAQKLQDDIMNYGLDAAYLHSDDVDGDWLEKWGENDNEPSYVQLLTAFLESDDSVAIKVRHQLQDKSIPEIIEELEKCLSLAEEEDRIFAVKNMLVGKLAIAENNRENSNRIDEIEFLNLAEELLETLGKFLD
ncbi:hypothetical protein [Anabaena sp. UHCC 0399]|uniref:hypothetical protein n=1 Tax=Anabaena sp. UHCC 0399 TaxID=3110238 RepID=UPI002B2123B4|nr:hypothetical protein [Anabaena sp. UHCC 0399]MEA5566949.1 hypothetical protein [Anabaena sp. UHCC 0399]